MILHNEAETINYGKRLVAQLAPPATVELVGDVGAGKTTLTKGIASGLGILDEVTSPSFVINKKYHGTHNIVLSHYDFYRLPDPGIMSEELSESINDSSTITLIEWAETVEHVLPKNRIIIHIKYLDDGTREVETNL